MDPIVVEVLEQDNPVGWVLENWPFVEQLERVPILLSAYLELKDAWTAWKAKEVKEVSESPIRPRMVRDMREWIGYLNVHEKYSIRVDEVRDKVTRVYNQRSKLVEILMAILPSSVWFQVSYQGEYWGVTRASNNQLTVEPWESVVAKEQKQ